MRMDVVVVFEPALEPRENRLRVGARIATDVVALERLDERFRHAVRLGASNRSESRHEAETERQVDGIRCDVTTAVVAEAFDAMRCAIRSEALLDGDQQHIADHLAAEAPPACSPCNGSRDRKYPR